MSLRMSFLSLFGHLLQVGLQVLRQALLCSHNYRCCIKKNMLLTTTGIWRKTLVSMCVVQEVAAISKALTAFWRTGGSGGYVVFVKTLTNYY